MIILPHENHHGGFPFTRSSEQHQKKKIKVLIVSMKYEEFTAPHHLTHLV